MAFSGLSTNRLFTPNLIGEDISTILATLAPVESPFLDWLGDSDVFALSTKHEYVMDYLRPHYLIASTAVASATAATAFQVNGLGQALTVGTILENESAAPELLQVTSIIGANSIVASRNYDGSGIGSLAAGGQFYVRGPAGIEGQEHSGEHTSRPGSRVANTVGLFNIPIAVSGTQDAIARNTLGNESFEQARAKLFRQVPSDLEKEVIRGKLNAANSLGTSSATRTMKGLRDHITAVNSTIVAASFSANPHLYIGNVWQSALNNGASLDEEWAIVAGYSWARDISNLSDTKAHPGRSSSTRSRSPKRCATARPRSADRSRPASASRARSWCAVTRCTSSRRTWTRTPAARRVGRGVAPVRRIRHRQQLHRIRRGRRPAAARLLPVAHAGAAARALESGSPDAGAGQGVMAIGWALDKIVYVSEYHRQQWEAIQPEIAPLGAVTKNGYDPAHVPTAP
jgi:hypothetical protein